MSIDNDIKFAEHDQIIRLASLQQSSASKTQDTPGVTD